MSDLLATLEVNNNAQHKLLSQLARIAVIVMAAAIMALNIRVFVRNADLFPGGATGLTLLIQQAFDMFLHIQLPYTVLNVAINAIPIYIGFRFIGKHFTLYSCVMIFLTGFFTDLIPPIPITNDILLATIFGGMINGLAISLVLNVDATSGGTDFIAIYFSNRKGMDSFNLVLGINAAILTCAGLLFGWDKALYSIVFQYVSTQVLHLLYKKYQKHTLFIVTNYPTEVCDAISAASHHGATIMDGEGAYEHCPRGVVYSVVSSAETHKVINAVKSADPKAFINTIVTNHLSGRFYQRPTD
ncbi:MAG: YitT family protein [Lachnospiraceae bacterium]|nr:YitT family protein [Candidatus Equihabitans merdae]